MELTELYDIFLKNPVVTTDTRDCPAHSLFFALRGANFNGNDFAMKALENGCDYAVADDAALPDDPRLIKVKDALATLQQLATHHRQALGTPIIQITGTNGKTTTKELTAAVLARKYRVHYTKGNFNNHIGVPKTLLQLTKEHDIAVVETGANHPHEIAELSEITDADCGLITNVGKAHLEGFGSFEGVLNTKTELYDYLRRKPGAFIFLNTDNGYLLPKAEGLQTETYGTLRTTEADTKDAMQRGVEGEVVECNPALCFRFRTDGGEWHRVQTHLIGSYNLANALAAIAVGRHFGVTAEQAAEAIGDYMPANHRSEYMKTERNELIVDAYNANPTSMKAALDNFALIPHPHKMLILGEMRELGSASAQAHTEVARQAAASGAGEIWFVGDEFRPFSANVRWFPDVEAVKTAILGGNRPSGCLILIKGSNSTRLYQLPEVL